MKGDLGVLGGGQWGGAVGPSFCGVVGGQSGGGVGEHGAFYGCRRYGAALLWVYVGGYDRALTPPLFFLPPPRSHPLSQAVSFSIPFGLDSDVDIVMGNPLGGGGGPLARSASSDSLALPPHPPHSAPHRRSAPPQVVVPPPPLPTSPSPPPPTIEEALQIIQGGQRLVPEGAPAAFYLHSPGGDGPPPPIRDSPHIKGDPPAELGGARKDGPKEDDGGKRDGVKGKDPPPQPSPKGGHLKKGRPLKGHRPIVSPLKSAP